MISFFAQRFTIVLLLGLALSHAQPAQAVTRPALPAAAAPLQFYVFSFTDTPAAEAAQDIVVGALARDLTVDPAVDGLVTFRADGWYGDEALLQDFGTALLDQDIALMRTGDGAYALVPSANVPMLMARGGTLMRLAEPAATAAPTSVAVAVDGPSVRTQSWWDSALAGLLLFFAGAAAGAAALFGGQVIHRHAASEATPLPTPLLRLTDQRASHPVRAVPVEDDPDLIIPSFEDRL